MVENLKNIKGRHALVLFLIFTGIQGILFFPEVKLGLVGPILVLFLGIILLLVIVHLLKKNKINLKSLVKSPFNSIKWYKLLGILLATMVFSFGVLIVSDYLFPTFIEEDPFIHFSIWELLIVSIDIALFAPIIEEIVFRGILLQRWADKWNKTTAILLSSAIFALLHFDLIGSFVFGIIMALLFLKTQNLMVPITAHMVNNFITVSILLVGRITLDLEAPLTTPSKEEVIVAIVIIALTLPILTTYIYKNWPRKKK